MNVIIQVGLIGVSRFGYHAEIQLTRLSLPPTRAVKSYIRNNIEPFTEGKY